VQEEDVNMKAGRKESLFPREVTHKRGESSLIQPKVLESLKNLGESLSLI